MASVLLCSHLNRALGVAEEKMFRFDDIDFGIESGFRFSHLNDVLDLDISSDESVFDALTEDDSHPYSWALYPPKFYISGLKIPRTTDLNNFEYTLSEYDIDVYDIGLYFMDYYTVFPCKIVGKNGQLSIIGSVIGIEDDLVPLRIELTIT